MALIDDIPEPTDAQLEIYAAWWKTGQHPPHRRVWHGGIDVTDQDPSTWPTLWTTFRAYSRSRAGRSSRHG